MKTDNILEEIYDSVDNIFTAYNIERSSIKKLNDRIYMSVYNTIYTFIGEEITEEMARELLKNGKKLSNKVYGDALMELFSRMGEYEEHQ